MADSSEAPRSVDVGQAAGSQRQHVAVALSGGGHRAGLFGLGALLYLVDVGKGPEIAAVSSISGGSLSNGFVGATCDLTRVEPTAFWREVKPLAQKLGTGGTVWASPLTFAYLVNGVAIVAAAVVFTIVLTATWSCSCGPPPRCCWDGSPSSGAALPRLRSTERCFVGADSPTCTTPLTT
jgi:hypothetical protein